jgi:hypothetical protein
MKGKEFESYSIYRLFDKRVPEATRYVGVTANLPMRLAQHLSCNGQNPAKDAWIQTPGVEVGSEVIETRATWQEAKEREAYWITFYLLQGMPLTNQHIPSLARKGSGRDYETYLYLTIAVERGGPVHQGLLRDAQSVDSQSLPTIAALRLLDYYTGNTSWASDRSEQESEASHANGKTAPVVTKNRKTAEANADAALDEW